MADKTQSPGGAKFGEAVILFILILGLTVFIGVKVASHGEGDQTPPAVGATATEPVQVAETPAAAPVATAPDTVKIAEAAPVATEPVAAEPAAVETPAAPPAPVSYAAAEDAYRAGSYDEAADLFSAYVEQNPQNAWGRYMQGLALWKSGDAEGALDGFQAALAIAPDHVKSLVNSGRVLLELQRPTDALELLNRAVELAPGDAQAARVLARAQAESGHAQEAEATYRDLLDDHPDDVWALNNLGLLLIQQDRFSEAVVALARAAQLDGGLACVQNNLGMALEHTGRFAAAREAYGQALQLDDGYAKAEISLKRLEGVQDAAGLPPFDLATAAAAFAPGTKSGVAVAVNQPTPSDAEAQSAKAAEENR